MDNKLALYATITIELRAKADDIVEKEPTLFNLANGLANALQTFLHDHSALQTFKADVDLK